MIINTIGKRWTAAIIWGVAALLLWTMSWLLQGGGSYKLEGSGIMRNADLTELFAGREPGNTIPSKVPVPSSSQVAPAAAKSSEKPAAGSSADPAAAKAKEKPGAASGATDLNRASAAELEKLPGIGPSKAKAIAEYREQQGPFRSIDDLKKVKGIGDKTFESLKPFITVVP